MTVNVSHARSQSETVLFDLARRAWRAESAAELQFILVNQTLVLTPYQVGLLWIAGEGVVIQSGVSHIDRHSPFVLSLNEVCERLADQPDPCVVSSDMLSPEQLQFWGESLPAHAVWLPINESETPAGLLVTRETSFSDQDISLLAEWLDIWARVWVKVVHPSVRGEFNRFWHKLTGRFSLKKTDPDKETNTTKPRRWKWALWLLILIPVRLTVLAPGEVVPANPAMIRVPIEGVVDEFYVTPNDRVVAGQPLFSLDLTSLLSKLQVAQQEIQVATQEYRQSALQSLTDPKSRGQLAAQEGKAAERKIEADYLQDVLNKAKINAPRDGIVIFDDPTEWIGKPVVAGEKVMMVATEGDVEIEAWIPVSDIIEVPKGASVTLYLNAAPFSPVVGHLRYLGHKPIQRPDGSYAYRLRAALKPGAKGPRVGLKGTVKVSGQFVPIIYWILRKPLASLRQYLGI